MVIFCASLNKTMGDMGSDRKRVIGSLSSVKKHLPELRGFVCPKSPYFNRRGQ
jgi:hypothetical protein